jgi:hypothetical protein
MTTNHPEFALRAHAEIQSTLSAREFRIAASVVWNDGVTSSA